MSVLHWSIVHEPDLSKLVTHVVRTLIRLGEYFMGYITHSGQIFRQYNNTKPYPGHNQYQGHLSRRVTHQGLRLTSNDSGVTIILEHGKNFTIRVGLGSPCL